jgi:ribose transport system permease protein
VLPIGAVVFGILVNGGLPVVAALVVAVLAGAAAGLVNGAIITVAGIDPLITTLGMLSVTGGLALVITNGVNKPFDNMNDGGLAVSSVGDIPNPVWILVGLALAAVFVLRFTVYGRMLYALGGNREASRLAGLRTALLTTSVYVVCGALAAFAGVVVASQLLSGSPTVGRDASLTSIAAVILGGGVLGGGRGGVLGTLLGVLVLGTLSNGLALLQIPSFYQQIATGGVLLIAVGFSRLQKAAAQGA